MFKPGDRVIFLSDIKYNRENRIYTVKNTYLFGEYFNCVYLKEIKDSHFLQDSFISLKEYRKQKLKKICSKKEIN